MTKQIHIVCLDAPSPPDYGGVFDLYYKIPALAAAGCRIKLHYFSYKQGRSAEGLEKYCYEIHSYPRSSFPRSLFSLQSYIIHSRINQELISKLNRDDHPVLLEGIHSAGIIPYLQPGKRALIRMHNDEAVYYHSLAKVETNPFKKLYFLYEHFFLGKFQSKLNKEIPLLCVSTMDSDKFKSEYGFKNSEFIPCFLPWQDINSQTGKGDYCLYHGNLLVEENIMAVNWLLDNVFSRISIPFVIAGKNASAFRDKTKNINHVRIISDPSDQELEGLISNAHINLLPSFNKTGVKIKLLHALFTGRYCVTNLNGVKGSETENAVLIAETPNEFIKKIEELFSKDFSINEKTERSGVLSVYNNYQNAIKLSALL